MNPLVVSYGAGADSTAVLIALHQRGIRPDLILFADTAGEKPETYSYLPIIGEWLDRVGFPAVTTVKYQPKRATYHTLEAKCITNETLPSLAYGFHKHSCAIVFKHKPQDKYLARWPAAKAAWAAGGKVTKIIGYDNGEQDRRRATRANSQIVKSGQDRKYRFWYPLQDWAIDRLGCIQLIQSAGLPVPIKSACFYCPASKKSEIVWLRERHPELFNRALAIEERSRTGRHGFRSIKGLGGGFAWADLADESIKIVHDNQPERLRP